VTAQNYDGVALVCPVSLPYERYSEHGAAWFIGRVLAQLIERGGIEKSAIDGLAVASFTLAPDTVVSLTEYFSMTPRWLEHLPFGGASGVMALRRAARAVQNGDAEVVACIGADTNRRGSFAGLVSNFSSFVTDAVHPYGGGGPNTVFAMITRHYMERFGATREDFGRICIAQRHNASTNPRALLREPLTLEDYLSARPIADPLHLYDCVMPCAGGEGFLVMHVDRARRLQLPHAVIRSAGELHNAFLEDAVHERGGWALYRDELFESAGLGPGDIDLLQTYDDYPVIVMLQLEGLGFCGRGEAPRFVRETALTFDGGGLPHNTSGGQLSCGQAGAAGGFIGIVEALRQLTETGQSNTVPDAKTALVSGYGMVNYDRCLCTAAAIISRSGT
jgi:acetyl-CoA acetyltransferase